MNQEEFNEVKQQVLDDNIPNSIITHLSGSHAYGLSRPDSDIDVRGLFCADPRNIRTPWFPYKEQVIVGMEDAKVYELTNFMKLYLDCNPNIIETLWVEDEDIITTSEAYEHLHTYRQELLSKKVAFTYSGYALSQMKRIKGHNKWINNPQPDEAPSQCDYVSLVQNFTEGKILPSSFNLRNFRNGCRLIPLGGNLFGLYDRMRGYQTFDGLGHLNTNFVDESRFDLGPPQMLVKFNKEEYIKAKDNHYNYWHWKENRNKKRSELEEEHGFDTKHASHLVRLLRQGEELLETGLLEVKRKDAEEIKAIRDGAWSYDELVAWAESKDKYIRGELYQKSSLRKKPDYNLAGKVLMEVQDIFWNKA